MRNRSLISVLLALSVAACASAPGEDAINTDSADDGENESTDGGAKKDAGHSGTTNRDGGTVNSSGSPSSSGSSSSITIKSDAGSITATNPLEGLSGLLGGGASDAGKAAAAKSDGGANQCENLICFDIFDCAIFHTDALDCGFTACTGFVCTK